MKYFANWKLNLNIEESLELAKKYLDFTIKAEDELIVSPPMFVIDKVRDILGQRFKIYSQDVSKLNGLGGFTGEVTATILKECGFTGSLLGHTERRTKLNETNEDIRKKLFNCLNEGMNVVLSVGEYGKDQFDYEETISILTEEFQAILFGLNSEQTSRIIVAYEDSEGISSMNVSPITIGYDELHKKIEFIKNILKTNYNFENPIVLYGGSVNPQNVHALKTLGNLDGFVMGKATLDYHQMQEVLNF
jgi:triosephosphate isomerase